MRRLEGRAGVVFPWGGFMAALVDISVKVEAMAARAFSALQAHIGAAGADSPAFFFGRSAPGFTDALVYAYLAPLVFVFCRAGFFFLCVCHCVFMCTF